MILEQIVQDEFALIIRKLKLNLNERLLALQNKFGKFSLQVLNISEIFECKVNHISRIVYLFTFVKNVKPFQVLTFFVAFYLFFHFFILCHSTQYDCLTVSTFAFYEYLCLTCIRLAFFVWMTKLTAYMPTIFSGSLARFSTRLIFMGLFASSLVALQIALMTTFQ